MPLPLSVIEVAVDVTCTALVPVWSEAVQTGAVVKAVAPGNVTVAVPETSATLSITMCGFDIAVGLFEPSDIVVIVPFQAAVPDFGQLDGNDIVGSQDLLVTASVHVVSDAVSVQVIKVATPFLTTFAITALPVPGAAETVKVKFFTVCAAATVVSHDPG